MDFEIIGQKIKKRRKFVHLTQKQLAEKIGKTESSIQKYEAGKVEIPFNVLEDIAASLDAEIIDLIDDFTYLEMENNIDWERDNYLVSLGYQTDSYDSCEFYTIKYNGYSYKIPSIEYLELLSDIDHHTHYAIDRILEKNAATKQICNEYTPIIKHKFKISPE